MTAKEALSYYAELALTFDKKLDRSKYVYTIHDNEKFREAFMDNPPQLQKVYWQEILQRAHWAGLSSLLRNLKWIDGVNTSIKENNFLSFTANLRCLIESCGDNFLSLRPVATTLADNHHNISNCLSGQMKEKTLFVSKELEEILIHFAYARKISKEEKEISGKFPKYQNAKPAAEYLKQLDNKVDNGPISELYSFLCQFSHPAALSIHYLFEQTDMDDSYEFTYLDNPDVKYINMILESYNDEIMNSIMFGFNTSLLTLKTLNLFDYVLTKTPIVDMIDLSELKTWKTITDKFKMKTK
ncbi:hypothetical protein [Spirosoma validum]|uniref:Uncharacterized protein n=1 Tax=Spirosoma validum TaxID=2771355 RepID=A0A927B523_9BACT|nr:hypothetical protein [Spirosoma validum]MBD2755795.1 hypothetical protein [Spirosoma validum]